MTDGREQQITNPWWQKKGNYTYFKRFTTLPHLGVQRIQDLLLSGLEMPTQRQLRWSTTVKSACELIRWLRRRTLINRFRDTKPRVYWKTDFIKVKPENFKYKCLLMFIDTFSGWTEAFPSKHKTPSTVNKEALRGHSDKVWASSDNRVRQWTSSCVLGKSETGQYSGAWLETLLCI